MIIYLFFLLFPWPAHGPHTSSFFFPAPISQLLRTSIAKLKGCVEVNSLDRVIPLQFYHTFSYTYPMINLEQLSFVSLFQLKYERDGIFRFHDNLFSFSTNQPLLRNKSFIVRLDITRLPPRTQQMYSIPSPYVFHKFICLSNATHKPMQITSVDDEGTQRGVRIRIQTVKSVAGGDNVRSTRSDECRPTQLMHERLKPTPQDHQA